MTYQFDGFCLLRIVSEDGNFFKVFGGRAGGYLDSDSWRLNSGVKAVSVDESWYYFHGYSGSIYKVPKGGGHLTVYHLDTIASIMRTGFVTEVSRQQIPALIESGELKVIPL